MQRATKEVQPSVAEFEETFPPITIPVITNISLAEETESTGSLLHDESFSAFSFADSIDGQDFENSLTFEMDLPIGNDQDEGGPNPVVNPNRTVKRSSEDTPPPRPSRRIAPPRCRSDVAGQGAIADNPKSTDTTPTPPVRRLPQRNQTLSSSRLNRSLSNLNGCTTPLSRQRSKLCLLSKSNHNSQHSTKTSNSTGTISRGSVARRRQMERSVSGLTSSTCNSDTNNSFDGNGSFAQLQVGDRVMLANKELSTSAHLIRRMPRQRRSRRNIDKAPRHNSSSSKEVGACETLMDRIAARSRQ